MAQPPKLTGTSYVILCMLRLGRRSGYDIKAFVDVSTRFFWPARRCYVPRGGSDWRRG